MNEFLERLAQDAAPIRDRVRESLEGGSPMRIAAGGSWLDAGRPVRNAETFDTNSHAGVIEYVPGDLTMTVRAATALTAIATETMRHAQWLALDPFGHGATIGATVSTASAGPLAHAFGTPRDQIIGVGFVTGRGDYVRAGGRVVKNVAGFDLTRLVTGSWGTLGVITDVSLRLRPLPESERTVALIVSREALQLRKTLSSVLDIPLTALALELINPGLAGAIGAGHTSVLLARLGGNPAAVHAQREALASLGAIVDVDTDVWSRLREIEPPGAAVVRHSTRVSELGGLWRRLEQQLDPARAYMHATVSRGVVRCIVPSEATGVLRDLPRTEAGVTRIFERLPADMWTELAPSPATDDLSRRVRSAFDPASLLNPGILGELAA